MPRTPRLDVGLNYYHVINRAHARLQIFCTEEDCQNESDPVTCNSRFVIFAQ